MIAVLPEDDRAAGHRRHHRTPEALDDREELLVRPAVPFEESAWSAYADANGKDPDVTWPSGLQGPAIDTDGEPLAIAARQSARSCCESGSAATAW